jgi:hypothetical protein
VVPAPGLILFAGFTSITAVGKMGTVWQTERLSWEGLRITRIEDEKLYGFGWDLMSDKEVAFEVDLKIGRHVGGTRPATPPSP